MARIAFHLEIEPGQREAYRREHENVPAALESAYLNSDAGIERYSVFEKGGHVFGFMETQNPDVIKEVMKTSQAQAEWDIVMGPILQSSDDDIWMDEVYRMK